MAKKPTVTTLQSGFNSTETLNANFEALRDGFENTLSLDGSTPNAMEADLDLNGNDILNAGTILINGVDYLDAAQTAQAAAEAAQAAAEAVEVVTDAAVGTVTTLAEGVSATAAATASSGTVTFDFGLPTGATGATGLQGIQGPIGNTGPAGADGTDGINGTDGSDGVDGLGFTGGSYNSSTGVVTFASDDGLGFSTGDLRGADGADGADGTSYTDSDVDTHLNTSTATTGEVLSWTGTDYDWIAAGGGSPDLFAENYDGTSTLPSATGTNAVAVGVQSTSSAPNSVAIGTGAYVTHQGGVGLGYSPTVTGNYGVAIGANSAGAGSRATGDGAIAIGASYASGTDSFAAAIDLNSSTYGALSTNSIAIGKYAKSNNSNGVAIGNGSLASGLSAVTLGISSLASGTFSTAIGYGSYASAGNSVSVGRSSNASGSQSLALGYQSSASGTYSTAIGKNAKAELYGKLAYAAHDFGAGSIYSQTGTYVLLSDTTDATAEALTTNNSTAGTPNQVVLPNNSVYGFTGTVIAREDSSSTDDFAVWEIKGGAVRGASASTTALGSYNINKISESTGASNWSIALSADTTNGAVAITVTGEAAHNIRWVATVNTTEVTY